MKKAFIRCNASHKTGYGHVARCISLALALRERNVESRFFLDTPDAALQISSFDFAVEIAGDAGENLLATRMAAGKPDFLILDARPALPQSTVKKLKKLAAITAVIDDIGAGSRLADVLYLPPHPKVMRADFKNFHGILRRGFEWVILGNGFNATDIPPPGKPVRNLLFCMGGSDPWNLTQLLALKIQEACIRAAMRLTVTVGPGFADREELMTFLHANGITILDAPSSMQAAFASADAAIVTVCVSAYELAAARRPALYICPDSDYAEHASAFETAGYGMMAPIHNHEWLNYLKRLDGITPPGLMDGKGAARVAADLCALLQNGIGFSES